MGGRVRRLTWGVKQSFRRYVDATGGSTETGGGAARTADGEFAFDAAPGEGLELDAGGRPIGHGRFVGEVRFEAHGGMLSVSLKDPAVEIGEAGAVLTVADGRAPERRVEIARLDLQAMTVGEAGEVLVPAALAIDGIALLGDHYPPMTPLDPVRLDPGAA